MIEIEQLTKNYGLNSVLRGVNLRVPDGEFVTLVGANGAGKSTLLNILAGLAKPSSGRVTIGGWPLPQRADKVRRHIGLISHQPLLYRDLSAYENLYFFARLYDLPDPQAVALRALGVVGLAARQRDAVRTFSRGMVQRLTIARATLHEPDVLLLDEPYTGLDQEASALLDRLLQAQRAQGRTILLITHDLLRGFSLCDRVAILNRGRIADELARGAVDDATFLAVYRARVEGAKP